MRLKYQLSIVYFLILLAISVMGGYYFGSRKQKVEIAASRLATNDLFAKTASASDNSAPGDTPYGTADFPVLPAISDTATATIATSTAQPAIEVTAPAPIPEVTKRTVITQPKQAAKPAAAAPAPVPVASAPAPAPAPVPAQVEPTPAPVPAPEPAPLPAPEPTTKVS